MLSTQNIIDKINNNTKTVLQSGGEPLGPFDNRFQPYIEELENKGINVLITGSGGHASPNNLQYFVDNIKANIVIPIHGFNPHLLKPSYKEGTQFLPERKKTYILENHDIKKS